MMKKMFVLAISAIAAASSLAVVPAEARQGCGVDYHRGPQGFCRPNRPVVVVRPAGPRIGVFYMGGGYWDGRHYRSHRYWERGGWHYR
jgi:hypothetical protein